MCPIWIKIDKENYKYLRILKTGSIKQAERKGKNQKIERQQRGFLAGPSGIRAGWVLETKSRLGAE